jgi:outer membrane protein assembly factor BamD
MKYYNIAKICAAILITLSIIACESKSPETETQTSPEKLYEKATKELEKSQYLTAAEDFAKLYNEFPYSSLAVKAKLMEAFSYYEKQDFDMAVAILDEFIKLHPSYKDIAYAYYLKSISYYKQISDIEHDQEFTNLAKSSIIEMISKFPTSDYARELKIKLDLINDHLAGKEMEIGRFYLNKGEILAAINRFNEVVENYQTTNHVKEALARLVEAYLSLGIYDEAQKSASVLGHNYPESKWYSYSLSLVKKYNKNNVN